MSPYRGSDEQLEREISTVETIARLRLRRANDDLRRLAEDLADLRRERRRRQQTAVPEAVPEATAVGSEAEP